MNTKNKESKKIRALIRIGIFSALWIAVGWALGCSIGFFPPVLMILPCLLAILGSMILVVMQSKMKMGGGIVIPSFLFGLCLFSMAPYGLMFFFTFGGGIIGEVIYTITKRKNSNSPLNAGFMIGIMFPMLGLALGEYIPLCYMKEAYRVAYAGSVTENVLESMFNLFEKLTPPLMVVLCVITVLCSFFGFWWGKKIVFKHLVKNEASEKK